jgi:hypothetical protein
MVVRFNIIRIYIIYTQKLINLHHIFAKDPIYTDDLMKIKTHLYRSTYIYCIGIVKERKIID